MVKNIDKNSIASLFKNKKDISLGVQKEAANKSEFNKILEKSVGKEKEIQLSSHAVKRLGDRNMVIDGEEYLKLKGAIDKLNKKGGKDSLVLTKKAAYIIDVPHRKVVTAMDKNSIGENVFTKIDSTVIAD